MPLKLIAPRGGKHPSYTVRGTYLGRHVEQSTRTSKRAIALKILRGIERQIEAGEFIERGAPTFASAALAYMNAGGERRYIKKLLEHFGDKHLSQIGQAEIDAAAACLYPGGSAATRARGVYTPISAIRRHSGIEGRIKRPRGAEGNKATNWLWPEQVFAIFAEAEKDYSQEGAEFVALLYLLCYTGLRKSEALGLTWERVRLSGDDPIAYIPKTKNNEPRYVHLTPAVVARMANLGTGSGYVFTELRSHKNHNYLYEVFRRCAERAGVNLPAKTGFHIFRHTFATLMRREAGVDAQGLLATGAWKDLRSVHRYIHADMREESRKADLLPTPGRNLGAMTRKA